MIIGAQASIKQTIEKHIEKITGSLCLQKIK